MSLFPKTHRFVGPHAVNYLRVPNSYWAAASAGEREGKKDKKKEAAGLSAEEKAAKKAEARKLAEEEDIEMAAFAAKKTKKKSTKGMTAFEIEMMKEKEKKAAKKKKAAQAEKNSGIVKASEYDKMVAVENKNASEDIEARGIDQALSALSTGEPAEGKPQKINRKALHMAFEERELPILKEQKPGMKLQQYKSAIFEMWKKSPENPENWPATE